MMLPFPPRLGNQQIVLAADGASPKAGHCGPVQWSGGDSEWGGKYREAATMDLPKRQR